MKKPKILLGVLVLLGLLISALFVGAGVFENDAFGIADIRRAIKKSLPYLEKDGFAWMEGRISIQNGDACVSCHQVPFAVWSQSEARTRVLYSKTPDLTSWPNRQWLF